MSDLIVKDNALMNASYNLDLVEQRLILLAILEARSQAKELTQMTLLRFMQRVISINLAYTEQRHIKLWKMLLRTYLHVNLATKKKRERGRANITSRWVSQIAYIDETATVEIIFAPAVVPLITRLEEQFTQYDIEQISGLSSAYAVRMYELLICWRSTGKRLLLN